MLSLALACPDRRMIAVIGIESDHAVAAGEVVKVSLGSHSGQITRPGLWPCSGIALGRLMWLVRPLTTATHINGPIAYILPLISVS